MLALLLSLILTEAVAACPSVTEDKVPKPPKGYVMEYMVNGKDTIYVDDIPAAIISPRDGMSKREWRKYYKRVHNFSKAYPYAKFIASVIASTDSLFLVDHYSKRQQDKYLEKLKKDLLNNFEPIFRGLTLNQGLMMIRLIDRQVGLTPYYIIKKYLDGPTAAFWQGFAKVLGGNLKQPYDRFNEDKDLEELVGIWERGEFDRLYWSIFGKAKPDIFIPDRWR